jgi:hypothetical protein
MSPISRRALAPCTFAFVMAAALSGCSLNTDVSGASVLVIISGNQQIAPINTALPTELGVTVTNQFGERIENVTVNWTIISGGGSLSTATTTTDETGSVYVIYTTGPTAGQAQIRADAGNGLFINFNETITAS